jgi:pyruvate/2-oxoglutarate dehydrogenase complex dihydrolipoamide dehydrogenase (E3) component
LNESKIFDTILVATGRRPNVGSLNLNNANVDFSEQDGIYVNEYL